MTLNEEFMIVLSAEIKEKNYDLLALHKCLLKYENAGMDKDSMIECLKNLRNSSEIETEDVLLELMDFVVGYCNPSLAVFRANTKAE